MAGEPIRADIARPSPRWRVGEAARQAGVSVRALHHYETAGLLAPARTGSGHRTYSLEDVRQLQRIAGLRRMGVSLAEIRACLAGEALLPQRVLELRLAATRERIAELQGDAEQLEHVLLALAGQEEGGAFDLWTAVDTLISIEHQLDPEQFARWTELRREQGSDGIRERERRFRQLVQAIRDELERGTRADAEPVRDLARQWDALAADTYGHDDMLRCSMAAALGQVPSLLERLGVDRALLRFVGQALERAHTRTP